MITWRSIFATRNVPLVSITRDSSAKTVTRLSSLRAQNRLGGWTRNPVADHPASLLLSISAVNLLRCWWLLAVCSPSVWSAKLASFAMQFHAEIIWFVERTKRDILGNREAPPHFRILCTHFYITQSYYYFFALSYSFARATSPS